MDLITEKSCLPRRPPRFTSSVAPPVSDPRRWTGPAAHARLWPHPRRRRRRMRGGVNVALAPALGSILVARGGLAGAPAAKRTRHSRLCRRRPTEGESCARLRMNTLPPSGGTRPPRITRSGLKLQRSTLQHSRRLLCRQSRIRARLRALTGPTARTSSTHATIPQLREFLHRGAGKIPAYRRFVATLAQGRMR